MMFQFLLSSHDFILFFNYFFSPFFYKDRPEEATLKVRIDSEPLYLEKSENVDVPNMLIVDVKIDQTIEISCIAEGGNPKPLVSVTKNGKSIGKGPQPYQNNYNFVAKVDDHEAKFGCVSKNDFSTTDSSSEIELNVLSE